MDFFRVTQTQTDTTKPEHHTVQNILSDMFMTWIYNVYI